MSQTLFFLMASQQVCGLIFKNFILAVNCDFITIIVADLYDLILI